MITPIDKASRVLIPAGVRERAGFEPGTELDALVDEFGAKPVRRVSPPALRRVRGRWLAQPTAPSAALTKIDPAAWLDEERGRWP